MGARRKRGRGAKGDLVRRGYRIQSREDRLGNHLEHRARFSNGEKRLLVILCLLWLLLLLLLLCSERIEAVLWWLDTCLL